MSKSYKLTNKFRKRDWLPPYHIKNWNKNSTTETKEELEEFIRNTKIIREEVIVDTIHWHTKQPYTYKYIRHHNLYEVRKAAKNLEAIIWWENNPHREADKDDYFFMSYAKNPSHWNHWTYTKRKRAHDKRVIHKIMRDGLDPDDAVFYHKKKPVIYYW